MKRSTLALGAILLLPSAALAEQPTFPFANQDDGTPTGRTIVDLADDVSPEEAEEMAARYGVPLRDNSPGITDDAHLYLADAPLAALQALAADPRVEGIEPETLMTAEFIPNDPKYAEQWHMTRVGAESAWEYGCGRGVTVAVIDTGVACFDKGPFTKGTDLAGTRCVDGYNFTRGNDDASDDHGHGTHVAGTIAQTTHNGMGAAGLAFCANLMPIKVLSGSGSGTNTNVAEGIRFAVDHGAQIMNLSLGGPLPSLVIGKAVKHAQNHGVLIVAAAGNNGRGVGYPAAYDGVFAVSATDQNDQLAWFSSRGKQVGIGAPGVGVTQQTVCNGGRDRCEQFATWNGTSMATPHVAGAAAMLVGAGITDTAEVRRALEASARPQENKEYFGAGILDAAAALKHAWLTHLWMRAAALFAAFLWVRRRVQKRGGTFAWNLSSTVGALLTGTGLVAFAPQLGLLSKAGQAREWVELAARPLGEWAIPLLGVSSHRVFAYGALAPLLALALLGFGIKRLRPFIGGVAVGTAAYASVLAYAPQIDVLFGTGVLRLVMVPSVVIALWIARLALDQKKSA